MPNWLIYIIRILIATALGFAIGFERKFRFKAAGIRTHAVVAAGACLFMVISKYGFSDVGDSDGTRIAAQIVSGIGFIGAGMIMYRKQIVHGLTTAAGVWATAGVGMAVGAGMYFVSLGATALIIGVQCIMHINCKLFQARRYMQIRIVFEYEDKENEIIKELFQVKRFSRIKATRNAEKLVFTAMINTSKEFSESYIQEILKSHPFIISIDCEDDD